MSKIFDWLCFSIVICELRSCNFLYLISFLEFFSCFTWMSADGDSVCACATGWGDRSSTNCCYFICALNGITNLKIDSLKTLFKEVFPTVPYLSVLDSLLLLFLTRFYRSKFDCFFSSDRPPTPKILSQQRSFILLSLQSSFIR